MTKLYLPVARLLGRMAVVFGFIYTTDLLPKGN